jgi:hypothetical protein
VLCKRALAEQRKHEAERLEAALRDQHRHLQRRSARAPSLVEKFLQTKWGDYFTVGTLGRVHGWGLGPGGWWGKRGLTAASLSGNNQALSPAPRHRQGIGMFEDLPRVLRSSVPINNK